MDDSLFISYSHTDTLWMHAFKKHLNGILMDRCRIWTDEDISAGATWEDRLLGNLRHAAAGLVLVSPDYLVSPWCRRELKSLAEARRSNRLTAVYWVLLEPCGWKWTALAEFQAVHESPDRALLSFPEGPQRTGEILRCCETIAASLKPSLRSGDKVLTAIRAILVRSEHWSRITPVKALSEGNFSIVGRAVDWDGDDFAGDYAIKVLTNTPLQRMRELIFNVSKACSKIIMPSIVRTLDVFTDGESYEQRVVIVSEMARGVPLSTVMNEDAKLPPSKRTLTLDNIGVLLRRVAEALEALHLMKSIAWEGGSDGQYQHLVGPLLPSKIFYDQAAQRPQILPVSVTNFLWRFFDPDTFPRIVGPKSGVHRLPEKCAGDPVDHRADQYFLGMLALELLEGRELFIASNEQPVEPFDVLKSACWAKRHEQFGAIVSRLLAKDPKDRFEDMTEVVNNLQTLEDSSRALAKYSFRTYVAPEDQGDLAGVRFSTVFYEKFFTRAPALRKLFLDAHQQRTGAIAQAQEIPDGSQHRKLMDGLKAVLNFRPGSNPSSIDSVASRHAGFHLDSTHFEDFEASFIATLEQHVIESSDVRTEIAETSEAWKNLFAAVRVEMLGYSSTNHRHLTAAANARSL